MNGQLNTNQKLEEYKIFVEDTARFSDRRQTVHNTQVAIHTLFLGGVAALFAKAAQGITVTAVLLLALAVVLLIAALLFSIIWYRLTARYEEMIKFRCDRLKEMEKKIAGSHKMICRIGCRFEDTSFSDIEARLPSVFMGVYFALISGALMGLSSMCCVLNRGLGALLGCP